MKKKAIIILMACMALGSCTANFEEYNSNPYGVSDEELASGGIAEKMANDCGVLAGIVIPLQENLFQYAMSLGCEPFRDIWHRPSTWIWESTIIMRAL